MRALESGGTRASSSGESNWDTASVTPSSMPTSAWPAELTAHAEQRQHQRGISERDIREALKHGTKYDAAGCRIRHHHPMYSHGYRLVVITEADGTRVVTEFDRDNDL